MVFKKGYKPTEEQRKKQSETRKKLFLDGKIDMKKQMNNSLIKKKISNTLKGHKCYKNPERGKNISEALKKAYKNGTKTQYSGKVAKGKPERMMLKGKRICVSHYVWFKNTGYFPKKGEIIHHNDFNQSNNDFNNLELMNFSEHIKLHTRLRVNGIN